MTACIHTRTTIATQQQIRKFQPKLVAIKDAGKVKQLQELIKDVKQQPEILVGDEGAVEVRSKS